MIAIEGYPDRAGGKIAESSTELLCIDWRRPGEMPELAIASDDLFHRDVDILQIAAFGFALAQR